MPATQVETLRQEASTTSEVPTIEFIPNDEFEVLDEPEFLALPADCTLYSDREDAGLSQVTSVGDFDMMHTLPLLSAQGEAFLFRKMNYLKYRAATLQGSLDRNSASVEEINEFENLLANAEAARNHIAECNLRLVMSIARKFATNHAEFDELMSEGNMILLKAIDKFDFARGFRFSTYATHSVQRHFYRFSRQKKRRIQIECGSTQEMLGELPAADVEVIDADALLAERRRVKTMLARMHECLDEREHVIICERFGIGNGGDCRTLRDVASQIGLSKERVRQIQMLAPDKLRTFFGDAYEDGLALGT